MDYHLNEKSEFNIKNSRINKIFFVLFLVEILGFANSWRRNPDKKKIKYLFGNLLLTILLLIIVDDEWDDIILLLVAIEVMTLILDLFEKNDELVDSYNKDEFFIELIILILDIMANNYDIPNFKTIEVAIIIIPFVIRIAKGINSGYKKNEK